MLLASLLLAAASAVEPPAPSPPCHLTYPVAPDLAAARRIAVAVIASRPGHLRRRYILRVMPDRDDPGQWLAFQSLAAAPPDGPGYVWVQAGGGGVGMRNRPLHRRDQPAALFEVTRARPGRPSGIRSGSAEPEEPKLRGHLK